MLCGSLAQAATLGYWMGAPHAGKGHMTRAVAAVVRFGFGAMRLHRIEAACIPDNLPSMALLTRNGFRREGLARGYLKINDAWREPTPGPLAPKPHDARTARDAAHAEGR